MASAWSSDDNSRRQRPVYSQSFNRGGNRGNGFGRSDEPSKTMMVHTSQIGRVVGRGGANIRQLEKDSHCRIFVDKTNRTDKTEVRISGNDEDIEKACEMIENLVSNGDYSDSRGSDRPERRAFNDSNEGRRDNFQRQDDRNDRRRDDNNYRRNDDGGRRGGGRQGGDRFGQNERGSFGSDRNGYGQSNNDSYNQSNNDSYNQSGNNDNYSSNNNNVDDKPKDDFVPIDWTAVYAASDKLEAELMARLPKIVKETYTESPEVARMSPQEVAVFRENNMKISVSRVFAEHGGIDKPIPNPIHNFEQAFGTHPEVMHTIRDQGFEKPSPIQCQAWPIIMSGEDLIGIAQTGTGKTLAFLLPAFLHIEAQTTPREERVGPTVLILSPTRELALQIEKEINKYSYRDIKCVCVYGGGNRKDQLAWLKRDRPEIVVATPGRLDDFVMGGEINLESVSYIILDEADKMLEMGFECQIRKILINIRKDRQTIMTSATWPSAVRRLASQYSVNPVQVVVGSLDLAAVHSVTQEIIMVDEDEKRAVLSDFLQNMEPDDKVIVFCGKKAVTDDIASELILRGVRCQSLHGNREQSDREQALEDLKTGEVRILIATDVAARGIDIPDITHIFNLDFPKNIEEYVHRIGRTGRAGRTGKSVSLFCRRDWGNAAELIKILEEANQGVPEELISMSQRFEQRKERDARDGGRRGRGGGGRGGGGYRDFDGGGGGFRSRGNRDRY